MNAARHSAEPPAELPAGLRERIQDELERDRRWEYRLPVYGGIALLVLAAIVVVRTVFLHV
ncbi:hypothetical protein [Leifsonia sp. 21MFCrub1.1]|uniref:hypothetical protein n=1 Tax=Leifsonia sp. 21MFCrub1.1 TaxID=1798223 RepID=UPI00089281AC|nr:hypothetical protein [Leifsonia sp. 21MFCrub1.1]SEA92841.1 hypothetical protein SAMN04515680_2175 [Leifsonia sp. 21MFCrub1.1]